MFQHVFIQSIFNENIFLEMFLGELFIFLEMFLGELFIKNLFASDLRTCF